MSLRAFIPILLLSSASALIGNTLEPALYGEKILQLVDVSQQASALGALTALGTLLSMLLQPLYGTLSDSLATRPIARRWGPRVPLVIAGATLGCVALILIVLAQSYAAMITAVLLLNLGMSAVNVMAQSLVPDFVPAHLRGRAQGLRTLLDGVATIIGRALAGLLLARSAQWGELAQFAVIVLPITWAVVAVFITVRDAARRWSQTPRLATIHAPTAGVIPPRFVWWFVNRALFWMALISVQLFILFYVIRVLNIAQADAQQLISLLFIVLGAGVLLVLLPAGWLADRFGRAPLLVAGGLISGLSLALLLSQREIWAIAVAGMLVGVGAGIFQSASLALMADMAPPTQAARLLGIANIATAGGSFVARLGGGWLADTVNQLRGTAGEGYQALYALAVLLFLLSALAALPLLRSGNRAGVG